MTHQFHFWVNIRKNKTKPRLWQDTCTPMFIAAVFRVVKIRKQSKLLSADKLGKKMRLIHTYIQWNTQFCSVAQSCPTLCDPMNHSTPGLPVHHQLPEFIQTHAHRVCDAIQPSHPLSPPSPPAPNPSQQQGLFQWVSSSHQVAKVLKFQLQHQSFQWTPRTDML